MAEVSGVIARDRLVFQLRMAEVTQGLPWHRPVLKQAVEMQVCGWTVAAVILLQVGVHQVAACARTWPMSEEWR